MVLEAADSVPLCPVRRNHNGITDKALPLGSGELGSSPDTAPTLLCDLRQVTSPL